MHVLAIALYSLMKAENFNGEKENFRSFLIRNITDGELAPGSIKLLYEKFYSTK
jgi:hypothetical protein